MYQELLMKACSRLAMAFTLARPKANNKPYYHTLIEIHKREKYLELVALFMLNWIEFYSEDIERLYMQATNPGNYAWKAAQAQIAHTTSPPKKTANHSSQYPIKSEGGLLSEEPASSGNLLDVPPPKSTNQYVRSAPRSRLSSRSRPKEQIPPIFDEKVQKVLTLAHDLTDAKKQDLIDFLRASLNPSGLLHPTSGNPLLSS
jgi:hypothetical protein